MELSEHELNITELRRQRRPLWMSDLGIENYADIMGGGGDIWTDRIPPAWPRHTGLELSEMEEREVGPVNLEEFGPPEASAAGDGPGALSEPSYTERYEERSAAASDGGLSTEGSDSGAAGDSETRVGITAEAVKRTVETAAERVTGVVGSLKEMFKGKERK